ncbi:MAG: TauD/TfdA family dioxygenase [Burkholderiaceae bacterium]|nr:TauD/TfdA family dioxygenase [Burkholderiaceae bacterium]
MSIEFHPLRGDFVAEVTGIEIAAGVTPAQVDRIDEGLARYGVLVFRDQRHGDDSQQAFIEQFGPPVVANLKEIKSKHPHFYDIGTVDEDGVPFPPGGTKATFLLANLLWHTDGSPMQPPTRVSCLHAKVLPPVPPPTEYADLRAAWEALPADLQRDIADLNAEHSYYHSRSLLGMGLEQFSHDTLNTRPPQMHPLVRRNAHTGRQALYMAAHISHIEGWPQDKGRALVERLMTHATQPQFVYSHNWKPHDMVMWDDSWTMHRATPYEGPHPRNLRWSGVRERAPV